MALHLEEISRTDTTGWHVSTKLPAPDNITLWPLPPKSPELNPVENIWQFMRDKRRSNCVFKSYDDILDHLFLRLEQAHRLPWKIMFIGAQMGASVIINETWYLV
jgi:putative transposase